MSRRGATRRENVVVVPADAYSIVPKASEWNHRGRRRATRPSPPDAARRWRLSARVELEGWPTPASPPSRRATRTRDSIARERSTPRVRGWALAPLRRWCLRPDRSDTRRDAARSLGFCTRSRRLRARAARDARVEGEASEPAVAGRGGRGGVRGVELDPRARGECRVPSLEHGGERLAPGRHAHAARNTSLPVSRLKTTKSTSKGRESRLLVRPLATISRRRPRTPRDATVPPSRDALRSGARRLLRSVVLGPTARTPRRTGP